MLATFWNDRKGATAMVMSLALVPIVATFTVAVNYSDATQKRSNYQVIADAAALSGATASTTDDDEARKSRAKTWFETQVDAQKLAPATVSVDVKNGLVTVSATAKVKPMVAMVDFGAHDIFVTASAAISQETIRRVLDVAMCIDATGSMQNTINSVKSRAKSFSDDLNNALSARGLDKFEYTRIRAVYYRDFAVDKGPVYYPGWGWYGGKAMVKSDFMEMPSKKDELYTFIASESATGGGDIPESGYECIHEGMTSKWFSKGANIPGTTYKADEVYPVIVLWTDAPALPVPHANSINSGQYPPEMPQSETAFKNKWNSPGVIDQKNRLLVQFGPCNDSSWAMARGLSGYMCGGSLNDGNTNMINKIADVMKVRYQNRLTRLTK
ncbi:MAG TPA: pilus assembly protein [Rhabdaerophilum sp.]|nr:pilus assembly protein [Rhabdaerophilum sp.]